MTAVSQFVTLYAGLSAGLAVVAAREPRPAPHDTTGQLAGRELGTLDLAVLNGGPRLAAISAAAALRGQLRIGLSDGRVTAHEPLPAGAGELERELYAAAGTTAVRDPHDLLARAARSASVTRAVQALTATGLLLDARGCARARRLWLVAAALAGLGLAGVAGLAVAAVAGSGDWAALLETGAILVLAIWLAATLRRRTTGATALGRLQILRVRQDRLYDVRAPALAHLPLAIALFGSGALWAADPAFAAGLGVPTHVLTALGGHPGWSGAGTTGAHPGAGCGGCGGCGCG